MKYCMDTSAFANPWIGVYTPPVFPGVWRELAKAQDSMVIIKPIYDELLQKLYSVTDEQNKEYLLHNWLSEHQFDRIVKTLPIEVEGRFRELARKYGIKDDSSKGAGLTDIRLIAFARHTGGCVVTQEKSQLENRPKEIRNYKIPLICKDEGVDCINLLGMLKRLGAKFA